MVEWVPRKPINATRVSELFIDSISTNQFTNYGPNVRRLEETVRTILKISESKAVVCVSNATHGLWAAIAAFELYSSNSLRVATQTLTFPASAQGYLKSSEIVDIDEDGGINLDTVQKDITDCLIVTNIFGNIVDIEKYTNWCSTNNKLLVFDNAATPYTFYKGTNSCNYGNAAIVSFHHTKPIGFGEGGCVIIDKTYEESIRKIINFGFGLNHAKWSHLGSNYKMSDIQAVYILQYLDTFEIIVEKHAALFEYFKSKLPSHIQLYPNASDMKPMVSCLCILTDESNTYFNNLKSEGVMVRKYYEPLVSYPIADLIFSKILCIPCTIDMSFSDIDRIIDVLNK